MKISNILTDWYKKNRRNLPWRGTRDPYLIWLSEIILQQTRISQGMEYYHSFSGAYPTVRDLAAASEEEVLKMWQGLGYYSRARNLHAAARQVIDRYDGVFPDRYDDLTGLKGVGSYTAAAVASISAGEPRAVVDGNVARVISRLFAVAEPVNTTRGHRIIMELANELLDREDPGTHNQAVMEFGALLCVPRNPACHSCPLSVHCMAFEAGHVGNYPVKRKRAVATSRFFTYFIVMTGKTGEGTFLVRRGSDDIWKSMYEFPMAETDQLPGEEQLGDLFMSVSGWPADRFSIKHISPLIIHQLTHRRIHARMVHVLNDGETPRHPGHWIPVSREDIANYPVPRLIDRYLEETIF